MRCKCSNQSLEINSISFSTKFIFCANIYQHMTLKMIVRAWDLKRQAKILNIQRYFHEFSFYIFMQHCGEAVETWDIYWIEFYNITIIPLRISRVIWSNSDLRITSVVSSFNFSSITFQIIIKMLQTDVIRRIEEKRVRHVRDVYYNRNEMNLCWDTSITSSIWRTKFTFELAGNENVFVVCYFSFFF